MTTSTDLAIYCVMGMHRSGTSLTAGALQRLGVDFGDPSRLDPPKPENPAGFFEYLDLQHLNDDILDALGGSWSDPPLLEPGWQRDDRLRPFRDRASDLVDRFREEVEDPAGWKDPRLSLLLPFWRDFVRVRGAVLVIRDPAEVVVSLRRRNGVGAEHASYLWIRYNAAAWNSASDPLLVEHASYWDDLDGTVDRLRRFVGSPLPSDDARLRVGEIFQAGLRRSVVGPRDAAPSGPMYALARLVHELIRNEEPSVVRPVLAALDRWTHVPDYSEADRLSRRIERLPVRLGLWVADALDQFRA